MPVRRGAGAAWLGSAGETGLGLILAAVPLALLVAWSPFVFIVVLMACGVSALLLVVLVEHQNSVVEDRHPLQGKEPMAKVPDEFIAEIHRIFPLTYHHSLKESARFSRSMKKLQHLLR